MAQVQAQLKNKARRQATFKRNKYKNTKKLVQPSHKNENYVLISKNKVEKVSKLT